jgi:hypothetical protein
MCVLHCCAVVPATVRLTKSLHTFCQRMEGGTAGAAPFKGSTLCKSLVNFCSLAACRTPWRPSLQRARYEGQVVRDQISAKLRLEAASGRRATKSELPNNHPSNHAGAVMQQGECVKLADSSNTLED